MPHLFQRSGDPRKTLEGTSLPGVYRDSLWSHSVSGQDRRAFFDDAVRLIDQLEPQAKFIADIVADGGRALLTVDLSGDRNIGDVLDWRDLGRLANLKIDLGVEVFQTL